MENTISDIKLTDNAYWLEEEHINFYLGSLTLEQFCFILKWIIVQFLDKH